MTWFTEDRLLTQSSCVESCSAVICLSKANILSWGTWKHTYSYASVSTSMSLDRDTETGIHKKKDMSVYHHSGW